MSWACVLPLEMTSEDNTMQITIKTNFPDVQRQLDALQQDVAQQATARALNRTVEQAKTAMSKEIRAEFVLPASTVNQALFIGRASFKRGELGLQASLSSISQRGKRALNLAHFQARETAKGVTFKIKRGGPRKLIPGAFLINDGKTVMIRVPGKLMDKRSRYKLNKHSQAIEARQTVNVAQMFNTKRINARVLQVINDRFPTIFEHEAKFYTDRFNARSAA